MTARLATALVGIALLLVTPGTTAGQPAVPSLQIEAPDSLAGIAQQIRGFDQERLQSIVALTGLTDPGPPIRVLLVAEDSTIARATPSWVAAFADGSRDVVVLLPARLLRGPEHFDR